MALVGQSGSQNGSHLSDSLVRVGPARVSVMICLRREHFDMSACCETYDDRLWIEVWGLSPRIGPGR